MINRKITSFLYTTNKPKQISKGVQNRKETVQEETTKSIEEEKPQEPPTPKFNFGQMLVHLKTIKLQQE